MAVCFTFDVEEHDRIEAAAGHTCPAPRRSEYARRMEASTRWLLEALADVNAQATFFVVGQIARTHPQLIRDMVLAGHEVGCHSWDHQRVHRHSVASLREDVHRARATLEEAAGAPVIGYRAPTFSITRETAWAIDVLADEGFRYDSSVFPVRHDRYGVPSAPRIPFRVVGPERSLPELPLATYGIGSLKLPAAGGGYFRLFPPAIMRGAIRQLEREPTGLAVLYFHPWEFDPSQPRLRLKSTSRLRTYVGIPGSRVRFKRLLSRYRSSRLIDVLENFQRTGLALKNFQLDPSADQASRTPS